MGMSWDNWHIHSHMIKFRASALSAIFIQYEQLIWNENRSVCSCLIWTLFSSQSPHISSFLGVR